MPDKEKPSNLEEYYDRLIEKRGLTEEVKSTFLITEDERKRIAAWCKEQDAKVVHMQQQSDQYKDNSFVQALLRRGLPYYGACGGALAYHFSPTGLGTVFTVSHALTKETLDLTDYDNW
jgi:hypothetical protein